jgi:Svf1-like N-terminal lipocalin domain
LWLEARLNIQSVKTTVQFNTQIFYLDGKTPALWCSDPLDTWGVENDGLNFKSDKCSIELNEAGDAYTIKSSTNNRAVVNVTFTRSAPPIVIGENGTSYYGPDPKKPWGSMRHSFWPRCEVKGSIFTQSGEFKTDGTGVYVHALQGMKPQHCGTFFSFSRRQSLMSKLRNGTLSTSSRQHFLLS